MMRRAVVAVLSALVVCGCGKAKGGAEPEKKSDLGTSAANVASDTALLREAQGAANEVLRNATDCDAARAALPEANRQLDEAAPKVRTPVGRQTLDALRTQVNTIARNCP